MAIDFQTIKSFIFGDKVANGSAQAENATGAGFDFAEFMRKQGNRMGNGLNDLSDRAGITAIGENSASPVSTEIHSVETGDDIASNGEHYDDGHDDTGHDSHNEPTAQTNQHDDYTDRQSSEQTQGNDGSEQGEGGNQQVEAHGENSAADDEDAPKAASNDDGGATDEGQGTDTDKQGSGENADNGEQNTTGKGDNPEAKADTTSSVNASVAASAEEKLAQLLASAQASGIPGQAADKSVHQGENMASREKSVGGLNNAINNVNKQNVGTNGKGAEGNNQAQTHNVAKTNTNAAANANANANVNAAISGKEQATSANTGNAAEQAAQLSKAVGDGNKVAVSVQVTDESKSLVSKPSSSLTPNAALSNDSGSKSLRAQQATANAVGNSGQSAQAETQASAGASAQTTQQAAQQAAGNQNQTSGTSLAGVKGAAQGPLHVAAAQGAGGGETTAATAPNTQTATQQAQHNTSPQAANAPRFTLPSQAILDQVSVNITKALNAGNDKINIQLRPADLGRVDVQMDIAADGRVTAVITADNKNTLDLLQRDSKQLQEALQQAGLQLDHESMSFNLREQNPQGGGNGNGGSSNQTGGDMAADDMAGGNSIAGMSGDIITDTRIDVRA